MNCFATINADASFWNDPQLAVGVAASGIGLLLATIWLMRRKSRNGRGAAAICLFLSIVLHSLLIYFLPSLRFWGGGVASVSNEVSESGLAQVTVSTVEPDLESGVSSAIESQPPSPQTMIAPLPLPAAETTPQNQDRDADTGDATMLEPAVKLVDLADKMPSALASSVPDENVTSDLPSTVDDLLTEWMSDDAIRNSDQKPSSNTAHVAGVEQNDFGQRAGDAKRLALISTGGDDSTEAAVEAALQFLAADQKPDGSWDPLTSGAGRETQTLGTDRGGAGKRATNGITGLALLSILGAGNTHRDGAYANNVHRGLSYLIRSQQPDGSLAGPATIYEANYCHGMAALAMCEAAAITGDEFAIRSAAAAVQYTMSSQHPTTGGWRYTNGDRGDLSQLGWQAMVLDGGRRASIPVTSQSLTGASNFLRSVRSGHNGGLASYRPGEAPTRTMTAEALATRLLLGEKIPQAEIAEAELYLLRQPPGIGKDNYYGWYYTSLALHQLQDDSWQRWNAAMKTRLVARQMPNGSWPTDDEWGGYGGRVYTTAMAALCLEVYYRHAIRQNFVAVESGTQPVDLVNRRR